MRRFLCFAVTVSLIVPGSAYANIAISPWIHEVVQDGQDLEVTINIFDESSVDRLYEGTEGEVPFPPFGASYTLTRMNEDGTVALFEDREFAKNEATNVSEYGCREGDFFNSPADCDGDGVAECTGFCATAYRYKLLDDCVSPGESYYMLTTRELEASGLYPADEGLGFHTVTVEDSGTSCTDACSVATVGRAAPPCFLALSMLAIGLVATRVRRKR